MLGQPGQEFVQQTCILLTPASHVIPTLEADWLAFVSWCFVDGFGNVLLRSSLSQAVESSA